MTQKASVEIVSKAAFDPKKLDELRTLKEASYKYSTSDVTRNDTVLAPVNDLHVELLLVYHKTCLRLAMAKSADAALAQKG